jgi:hypothetical protein
MKLQSKAFLVFVTLGLAVCKVGFAQVVVGSPRIIGANLSSSATASQSTPPGKPGALSTIGSIMARTGPIAQFGAFALRPYATYSFLYGDGLLRVPGEPVNTSRHALTLGLLGELGPTWTLDAATTRSIYSSRLLVNSYDNTFSITGKRTIESWRFGASLSYASNSPIVVETGGQNDEETTRTSIDIAYNVTDRTSIDLSATWSLRLADPKLRESTWTGSNWEQISIAAWFNYRFSPKLGVAAGCIFGEDRLDLGDDMSYAQPHIRLNWRPTDRISLGASGGFEFREVDAVGGNGSENPVYNLNAAYSPTMTTTISLSGSRNTSSSYFNNQTIETTQYTVGVSQRLLQRYFLSVSSSEGTSNYAGTTPSSFTDRDDRFRSYNTSLTTSLSRRGTVSVSYSYSKNSTTSSTFGYSSRQVGAELAYRF